MNCPNCNFQINEKDITCPNCDFPLFESNTINEDIYVCPVCGQENPTDEHKCRFCCSVFVELG